MRWLTFPPVPVGMREQIARIPDPYSHGLVAQKFAGVPPGYFELMLERYLQKFELEGLRAANLFSHDVADMFPPHGVGLLIDDDELLRYAEACARQVKQTLGSIAATSAASVLARLQGIAKRHSVRMPNVRTLAAVVHRMTREHWWRRQLRRRLSEVEHGAIQAGLVHVRAGAYVSDETFKRFQLQRQRLARTLEETQAVNQTTGEVRPLADLIVHSVSNPKVRRAEMMTRLRGMERYAGADGLIGMFYTVTCPSRMHARLAPSGEPNPKYEGGAPSTAQRYLVKLWAKTRTALERRNVRYFGLRVTEPHHDATPHWHLLVFVRAEDEAQLTETLRAYALESNSTEAGAAAHRFKVERIDPAKGGAVAYVAKYIAKNIDGEHVGIDLESGAPATRAAERIEAWARLWRVRQFQFFGTPSVVPWRELRRLRVLPEGTETDWNALWAAADAGEWCDYMQLIRAGSLNVAPVMELRESVSYPGELVERVRGVRLHQAGRELQLQTREDDWLIRWGAGVGTVQKLGPWTRVNNCTGTKHQGLTELRQTEFLALSKKLKGGPDFSLAILEGNLDALDSVKPSAEREEARREIERAISEVVSDEAATRYDVLPRTQHRNAHSAVAPSRDDDRAQLESSGVVEENEEALRHPRPPRAVLEARPGRKDDRSVRDAPGRAAIQSKSGITDVKIAARRGRHSPGERLAMGLDDDGYGEG